MADVGRHPNIHLLTLSEIQDIKGYVGNFEVTVLEKARFVNEKECTACGDCEKVCPVLRPNEYELGLNSRKAIFIPFPQSVPSAYVLDARACLGQDPLICGKCKEACTKGCIDYEMQDRETRFRVGTIVVATGMEPYDPTPLDEYGYTRFDNIITSMGNGTADQRRRPHQGGSDPSER